MREELLERRTMALETKFLHLHRAAALGEVLADGWRVTWLGGWDRGRIFFVVMVVRELNCNAIPARVSACR